MDKLVELVEPLAAGCDPKDNIDGEVGRDMVMLSVAVSLRRIADSLDYFVNVLKEEPASRPGKRY